MPTLGYLRPETLSKGSHQVNDSATPNGRPRITVATTSIALGLLALLALLAYPASSASAHDYSPGAAPYTYLPGPNGTYLIASSSLSANVALSDASGHFTARTGFSRVLVPSGSVSCGLAVSCTLYDIQATTLDWAPSCTVPTVASGFWAATHISAGSYNNANCMLGSTSAPVFVIAMKTSAIPNTWYAYQHVVRHELSHALGLPEATFACHTHPGITSNLPLMNNSPCASPYYNYYLTDAEKNAIISRSGWQ